MSYSYAENMKSVITAHNKKLLSKTSTHHQYPTAESRTNAHWMENAEPEIFYTRNARLKLVWNETKFIWKTMKEILNNISKTMTKVFNKIAYNHNTLQILLGHQRKTWRNFHHIRIYPKGVCRTTPKNQKCYITLRQRSYFTNNLSGTMQISIYFVITILT